MAVLCGSLVGTTNDAMAQTSSASSTEQIAFDRPEAWAMKYFMNSCTPVADVLLTISDMNVGSLARAREAN